MKEYIETTSVTTRNIDDKKHIVIHGCISQIGTPKMILNELQAAILYKQLQDFLNIKQ